MSLGRLGVGVELRESVRCRATAERNSNTTRLFSFHPLEHVDYLDMLEQVDPYVVHATFQFAGTEGKRHRFREAKLWLDPPAYYAPKGGVLTYTPDVPPEMKAAGAKCDSRPHRHP
eukprot:5342034-Pyramimonas_sp.AAC.1